MEHAVLIPLKLYEFSLTELTAQQPCVVQSQGGSSRVDPRFNHQEGSLHQRQLSLAGDAVKETKIGVLFLQNGNL